MKLPAGKNPSEARSTFSPCAAVNLPEIVCLNREVIAAGRPKDILRPDVLERTYGARMEVLEHGGDCADRSRLLIVLLRHEGIYATKVALHDSQGSPQHAVVSASIEDEDHSMVIDALFGMYFPKPEGGIVTVSYPIMLQPG